MAIYRGIGGAGDSTTDATVTAVTEQAVDAAQSATEAATSATQAATSAASASSSATNASSSATSAATSATTATVSKNAAATSANNAATSASAALTSETNAAASETAAATSETNAAASEASAETDAATATTKASEAATSATNAATSATSSASSATASATSAAAALVSETNASASETAAASSESNAASSETAAAASAIAADASANDAASSEANAAASETASAASAVSASTSATTATTQATAASTSASAAATSASNAATSETNAATSETNASASESAAASSATVAQAAQDAALAALDSFDDRYLGQKASDPTVDNDGDALVAGALYFNTTDDVMKVYEGSSWVAAYASLSGALLQSNNLSDVQNVVSARTNLGLGTAATTAATDYATAAQGALADTALQSYTVTEGDVTAHEAALTIAQSQVTGLSTALASKVDDSQVLTNVPSGAVFTDTTYSVGNGGLTEINFTSARSSKLDGIEAGATADQTITAGSGLSGGGTGNVTLNHADTSSQSSVNNSGTTFIQDITLDTYGHITGIGSASVTIPDFVPSGTAMLFQQTSAPTGWTKSTTHNDKALRVVSGTASSGGTTAMSTALGTPSVSGTVGISGAPAVGNLAVSMSGNIANTTLSTNTIPSHRHSISSQGSLSNSQPKRVSLENYNAGSYNTGNTGNSGAHGHSHNLSGVLNGAPSVGNLAGSLSSATAAINVQYVDIIIATKD